MVLMGRRVRIHFAAGSADQRRTTEPIPGECERCKLWCEPHGRPGTFGTTSRPEYSGILCLLELKALRHDWRAIPRTSPPRRKLSDTQPGAWPGQCANEFAEPIRP